MRKSSNITVGGRTLIRVGKVVGVHGIKGEVKVTPYVDCEKKGWQMLHLYKDGNNRVYKIKNVRPHKETLLISLLDCNTRDEALELAGSDVLVDRSQFSKLAEGEYYYFELAGMKVITEDKVIRGVIEDIFSTGSNDVYVVKGRFGEVLIPATNDVVISIDIEKRKMTIRMMEGLMP